MIRAQAGTNQFLFGLDAENLRRLQAGEPIVAKLNEFGLTGPPITIIICYGETYEGLAVELQEFIGPKSRITDYRSNRRK